MTIKRRLILLLAIPLIALAGLSIAAAVQTVRLERQARFVAETQMESLATIGEIGRVLSRRRITVRTCILSDDPVERDQARESFERDRKSLDRLFQRYADHLITGEDDARLLQETEALSAQWSRRAGAILVALDLGHREEASQRLSTELIPLGPVIDDKFESWTRLNERIGRDAGASLTRRLERSRRAMIVGGAAVCAATLLFGALTARGISRPIDRLRTAVEGIARGELSTRVPFDGRADEVGALAHSIEVLREWALGRERAEAEIKHINFLSDSALDLTKAGYWHVPLDDSGWYTSSERAARIFGDPPSEGHRYSLEHWAAHVRAGDEEAAKATAENFAAAVAGTIPVYNATYAYKRPVDGKVVWIHALGHVVKDRSGKPTDMYGVTQDITDFKLLEVDLRLAKKKADEATVAKSAFLANMSHEIRTPMNGIMGMTELALDTDLTAEQRDYLQTVKTSAEALLSLLNDILDFSKIEAGRIELDPVDFLLRDSMADTLSPLSLRASAKGIELAYDIDPGVPDAVIGDVYRLRQVLVNLVGNAIKFTEKGEVVLSARTVSREGDDLAIEFAVRDTGIGISSEAAVRLFKPFEQAEVSTTRKYGGTGLGLAISRQLVELMGGHIALESAPGVGSTFRFAVKLKAGAPRERATDEDASRVFSAKTALIVDDNETNRRIVAAMLANWGLRSIQADSAKAALALIDRTQSAGDPVSVVITDLHMPEMDGFDLAQAIRAIPGARGRSLPILLLSSSGAAGDAARCKELGIAARLLKPAKQSLLLDNLLLVLAGADQRGRSAQPVAAAPSEPAAPARKLRVLLAEDNPVNQRFALRVLEGAGHGVTVASNGREAVDRTATEAFDLILMDVQMPEMDGLDATRAIRAREGGYGGPARTPIIAMTANAMKGDREMCVEAGMDGYVPKPVRRELLFQEIDRVLKEIGRAPLA